MAFDQSTRNRLARFVSDTRSLLAEEFSRQLQNDYGLDPATGDVTDLAKLRRLDDSRHETARLLRETMEHYLASAGSEGKAKKARQEVLDRIVREQAFTVLNRLCALRMAEARGLLIESIAKGFQSKGFQLYQRLVGTALGETGECYRVFLFSVFDEFAVDLPVLFDRFSLRAGCSPARRRSWPCSARSTTPTSTRSGPRTRPSAGFTSTSTPSKSAGRCVASRLPRATAASLPFATSSSRRATSSSFLPTTLSAASGTR